MRVGGVVAGCALSLAHAAVAHAQSAQSVQAIVGSHLGSRALGATAGGAAYRRTMLGAGAEVVRVAEHGWIARIGAAFEVAGVCPLQDSVTFFEGCGGSDLAISGGPSPLHEGGGYDEAVHARGGWSWGSVAIEGGAIARSDFVGRGSSRLRLVAPDVVARLSGARGDLELGGGAYALPTILSPGLFLRGRLLLGGRGSWIAIALGEHEFGPWGVHPHLRFDLEAIAALGDGPTRFLLGGGFALLHADAATTLESRVTLGVAF